jgi:hypothetical protein
MINFIKKVIKTNKLLYTLILLVAFGTFAIYNLKTSLNTTKLGGRTQTDWVAVADSWIEVAKTTGYNLLIKGVNKYINFNTTSGESGYGIRDNGGTIEIKNSGGAWVVPSGGGGGTVSPLTTKGDLFTYSSTSTRLAVGINGQYLSASSTAATGLAWSSVTATETDPIWIASSTNYYTKTLSDGRYDVLGQATSTLASHTTSYNHGNFASAYSSLYATGTNGMVLTTDGAVPIWKATSTLGLGGGGSMVYPGTGIALSTGSGWSSSITNNSSNWNTAYGWGNHAGLYDVLGQATSTLGSHTTTYNHSNYNTAYGWGNHASAGYITASTTQLTISGNQWTTGNTLMTGTLGVTGLATFGNASTSRLSVSGDSFLGTIKSGTWNGSTITVPYGGTGSTTLNGLLKGNGTGAIQTATLGTDYINSVASDATWTTHNSYPSACSAGQYVTAIGDTLTCSTPAGGSQTPWTSNINGGGYSLTNVGTATTTNLRITGNIGVGTVAPIFDIDNVQTYAGNYGYATIGTRNLASDGWTEFALGTDASAYSGFIAMNGSTGVTPNTMHIGNSLNAGIRFWTNNDVKMTLSATGMLGIGTTTPNTYLSVIGSTTISNLNAANCDVKADSVGGLYCGLDVGGAGSQTPWTSNIDGGGYSLSNVLRATTTNLRVISDIGVGTTSPHAALHVKASTTNANAAVIEDGLGTLKAANSIDGYKSLLTLSLANDSNDYHLAYINEAGGKFANYITNNGSLRFNAYTTANALTGQNALMKYGGVAISDATAAYYGMYMRNSSLMAFGPMASETAAASNATPYMVFNSSGNVGIGTTVPITKFEVAGATTLNGPVVVGLNGKCSAYLTADAATTVTVTNCNTVSFTSNDTTSTNRTFCLGAGVEGQVLKLFADVATTTEIELADSASPGCTGSDDRATYIAGVWPAATSQNDDTAELMWRTTASGAQATGWYELKRSAN